MKRVRFAVWRAMEYHDSSVTLSERPNPMWSTAMHRHPAAAMVVMMSRYRYDQVGMPCTISNSGPSAGPTST